jgi:hypothetical protein
MAFQGPNRIKAILLIGKIRNSLFLYAGKCRCFFAQVAVTTLHRAIDGNVLMLPTILSTASVGE